MFELFELMVGRVPHQAVNKSHIPLNRVQQNFATTSFQTHTRKCEYQWSCYFTLRIFLPITILLDDSFSSLDCQKNSIMHICINDSPPMPELPCNSDTFSRPCCFDSSTMATRSSTWSSTRSSARSSTRSATRSSTQFIWIKLTSPVETPLTKVSLVNIHDVDDLKEAIKIRMSPKLDAYTAPDFILKAKKSAESDEQAVELRNLKESMASVHHS